ncbi:hypothetical protein [Streptomyces wuyuanensis]|uniref:hypothetical protein n=1 Tax=Streptomyces wuyuanensis TaxID=1196353 RepID=UPI0034349D90
MLTEEDARRLVLAEMEEQGERDLPPLGIHRVEEVSFGWVVHWGAVGPLPNGESARLGGNGPFLVDRENERVIRAATGRPVRQQVADYERRLRREAHARNAAEKRAARNSGAEPGGMWRACAGREVELANPQE